MIKFILLFILVDVSYFEISFRNVTYTEFLTDLYFRKLTHDDGIKDKPKRRVYTYMYIL